MMLSGLSNNAQVIAISDYLKRLLAASDRLWGAVVLVLMEYQYLTLAATTAYIGVKLGAPVTSEFGTWWTGTTIGRVISLSDYGLVMIFAGIGIAWLKPHIDLLIMLMLPQEYLLIALTVWSHNSGATSEFAQAIWIGYAATILVFAPLSITTRDMLRYTRALNAVDIEETIQNLQRIAANQNAQPPDAN